MKFLVDAGLPVWIVAYLAEAGHDGVHARQLGIGGAPDHIIAERARDEKRCIITRDFDFGDIRAYPPRDYAGIVVLTMPRDRGSPYIRLLLERLMQFARDGGTVTGKLLVVTENRIRVRD